MHRFATPLMVMASGFVGVAAAIVWLSRRATGGTLFYEGGALKHRGASGVVTTIRPA